MSWGGQTGSSKKNDGFSSLTKETQQLLQGECGLGCESV
mgnify:CR=1 FL=1